MWWMKKAGSGSGIFATAAAAVLLLSAGGCAQLPFGQHADADVIDPPAVTATSGSPAVPAKLNFTDSVVSAYAPVTGTLSQTTAMPGSATEPSADSRKFVSPVVLTEPAMQGGAIVPVVAVAPVTTIPVGAAGVINAEMNKFIFHSAAERARYQKAAARFPDFCHDWQRMLHDRETNNLQHLTWQTRAGAQTSTYVGYGQVDRCEMKESAEGIPIGKISYPEMTYYLAGKDADEARHTPPKLIHETHTLEIFSWEKDKWFY